MPTNFASSGFNDVVSVSMEIILQSFNFSTNLDTLLDKAEEITQKKRKETLLLNKDKALLSRKLVILKDDVPVKEKLESFNLKKINQTKLYNFLREMEFNRLLSQAISFYGEPDKKFNNTNTKKNESKIDTSKFDCVDDEKKLSKLVEKLNDCKIISIDTETTSLNPLDAKLVGISISYAPNKSFYIPIAHNKGKNINKDYLIKKIKPILEDQSIKSWSKFKI